MPVPKSRRVMMISLHGYVSGRAEFGRPDTGGQVVYVLRLSESLARLGYVVDIFTRQFEDQPTIEALGDRVRIVRIPSGGRQLIRKEWMCEVVPEWIANAEAYVADHGLEYAFIDSHYWDAGLAGDELAARLGIPHWHTPHSIGAWKRDTMDGDPLDLERQYNFSRRIHDERAIYHRADAVITTSPQQRAILLDGEYQLGRDRVAVIPPGFDHTRFFPVSAATRQAIKRDLGVDGPLILALGRVAANKGYDLLLEAMPTVFKRLPEARLMLAVGSTCPTPGEARQVEDLKRLAARLGIGRQVTFRDYVPDEQLADTYRAADVFALSSRYEPFGMTAVEAMACGTPSVITTAGGLWEMIAWGSEAIYADPLDPSAFAHAILTVLRYPRVAQQLARFGSHRARASFTWNGIAQQLINLMARVESPGADSAPWSSPQAQDPAVEWGPGRILVSDLDGTLLGDDGALARFREWLGPRRADYRLVYASGRRLASVQEVIAHAPLPQPDAIISGVGTELHDAAGRPWPGWAERFDGWDADAVRNALQSFRWLEPQADERQSPLKASYDIRGLTASDRSEIRRALAEAGLEATIVYSGGLHLDVLPPCAGKGRGAHFLADRWAVPAHEVLAFGDSGNDMELLTTGFRGTIVANALPELRLVVGDDVYQSPESYADGVLDGMRFWSTR